VTFCVVPCIWFRMDNKGVLRDKGEFKALMEMMRRVPDVEPPPYFLEGVMGRLPQIRTGVPMQVRYPLFRDREFSINPYRAINEEVTIEECSFYFVTAGFACLIVACVMFLGLQSVTGDIEGAAWLHMQPRLASFLACWFFAFGVMILKGGPVGLRAARLSVLAYVGLILVNGVFTTILFGRSPFFLPFFSLTLLGLLMGAFLGAVADRRPVECGAEET
jgi:hypothetical protein